MGDITTIPQPDTQVEYTARGGRRTGRPTIYSEEIARAICDAIRKGASQHAAAHANGITRETLLDWARTRDDFSYMLLCAEGKGELTYSDTLHDIVTGAIPPSQAGDRSRAAVEVLKRRYRASGWGDQIDVRKLDDDTILRLLRASQDQAAITEDGRPAIVSGEDDI